ncbi:MAG TPA: hypothetical protein VGN20_20545 [Mucilaginibacter sp.]|jgi:hypothetical protein
MENKQLIINDVSVDFLSEEDGGTNISLTLQVNDLGDPQSLQNNYTKSFQLPLTQKNRAVLGFPDDIAITNNLPYTQLSATFIEDGIEVISNGIAEIIDVQNNVADITVLSGNCDFLDKLGGQIYDMGDSTSQWSGFGTKKVFDQYSMPFPNDPNNLANCIFDVPHAALSQKKTDGWIWPIVNYGGISTIPPFTGHINVRNLRPGFFLHTAIGLLVQSTGYSIDKQKSCIYNDPHYANLYPKLIVQFDNSDFEHGTDFQNTPDNLSATYTKGSDQVISRSRADIGAAWDTTNIYQNDAPFSNVIAFGPSDHFIATTNVDFTATLQFDLFVRGRLGGSQATEVIIKFTLQDPDNTVTDFAAISFFLDQNSTVTSHNPLISQETFLSQKLSQDFSLVTGQKLYVRCHINNIGQNPSTDTYVIFKKGASFDILTNEKLVLWEQPIQCERILPDVAQIDFLKDTLQRFGLILISDPNAGTIIFTSFKAIVANLPNKIDWSEKCVDIGKQVSYQLGNYSQVNKLKYQQDTAIPLNYMPKFFADDQININDKTLNPTQPEQDLFTSIFGPTINRPYIGGTLAQISDPTVTDEFSVGSQPRLLIDEKLNISNMGPNGQPITVIFSDADLGFETVTVPINDVISVPFFYKPDAPDLSPAASQLAWKDLPGNGITFSGHQRILPGLKSKYYSEFENILNQTKKVTRYFYLTPLDIAEFDPTIPVYIRQDGADYYVSKIDSWEKGKPCKVDLVRL